MTTFEASRLASYDEAVLAFTHLGQLYTNLGLESSPTKDCLPSTRMIFLGLTYETVVVTLDKLHQTSQLLCYWLSSLRVSKSDISFSTNRHLKRDPFTRDGPNLVLFLKEYTVRRIVEERMKGKVMILERKILTKYKHWAK